MDYNAVCRFTQWLLDILRLAAYCGGKAGKSGEMNKKHNINRKQRKSVELNGGTGGLGQAAEGGAE